jgi:hypothetical protein
LNHIIEIDKISDGMVLADDILNSIGQIVLPAGVVLAEKHKIALKRFKINSVKIIGDDKEIDQESIDKAKNTVLSIMDWKPRNPQEKDLLEAVSLFRAHNKYEADREDNI